MGYPMTYHRVIRRNHLNGDYHSVVNKPLTVFGELCRHPAIAGDLRRLEKDQLDDAHLKKYAERAGIQPGQAKRVLQAFFDGEF